MPKNCHILCLMIKTNIKRMRSHKVTLLTAMITPVAFSFVIMIVQLTPQLKDSDTEQSDIKSIQYEVWWNRLVDEFNERRAEMMNEQSTFQSNVFIPKVILAYAPNSSIGIRELVERASRSLSMTPAQLVSFQNCEELRLRAHVDHYMASICFNNVDESQHGLPLKFNFSIILPSELRLYEDTWIGDDWKMNYVYNIQPIGHIEVANGSVSSYVREGFISLQHYISVEYLRVASDNAKIPTVLLRPYELTTNVNKLFLQGIDVSDIILLIGFMFPITVLTMEIVGERELDKHFAKCSNPAIARLQVAAWFLTGFLLLSITCIIFTVLLKFHWFGNLTSVDKCPWFIMLPFFTFYVLSAVSFSLLMAVILKSSQLVLTLVPVYWVFFTLPFFSNQTSGDTWTNNIFIAATFLFCNVTMCRGLRRIMWLEEFSENFDMKQYILSTLKYKDPTLLMYIGMFILQTFVYVLLALFLDGNMFPWLLNILRCEPCRILLERLRKKIMKERGNSAKKDTTEMNEQKEKHLKTISLSGSDQPIADMKKVSKHKIDSFLHKWENINIEKIKEQQQQTGEESMSSNAAPSKPVVIEFDNVWKRYNKYIYVVRKFSLKVYQNEMVVLLGHNSSGKSTLIKMLCGKFKPTMGKIFISGYDVVRRPKKAYESVGVSVCDIQPYAKLTVSEHLFYICRLRGLTIDQSINDVELYMGLIKIENLKQRPIHLLSHGQKQLLMNICAFVGRTKIVIMDKPMEGIDSQKRLLFYQLALLERNRRTILITTNLPTLASYLGDRIGILVNGSLFACNKERILLNMTKNRYRLICYLGHNCDFTKVLKYLYTNVPNIKLESKLGDAAIFQIRYPYLDNLMQLLSELSKNRNELNLDNYYLITPKLEHILMNAMQAHKHTSNESMSRLSVRIRSIDQDILKASEYMSKLLRILAHIEVVLHKRLLMSKRCFMLPLLQIFLPSLLCVWTLYVPQLHSKREYQQVHTFTMNCYGDSVMPIQLHATQEPLLVASSHYKESAASSGQRIIELNPDEKLLKYMRWFISNNFLITDLNLIVAVSFGDESVEAYFNNNLMHSAPISLALVMDALAVGLVNPRAEINVNFELLPYSTQHNVNMSDSTNELSWMFIVMSCCGFCFVWTLPLLTFSLSRIWESPFKQLELIAGMHCLTLCIANFIYSMIMVVISLMSFNIILLLFFSPMPLDSYYTYKYIYIVLVAALCVHSIDVLISFWLTEVPIGFLVIITANILGIVIFISTYEGKEKKTIEVLVFIFHPFYALIRNLILQRYYSEINAVCADVQTYETSVFVEHCRQDPCCCKNHIDDNLLWNLTWTSCLTILLIWTFLYVRLSISKNPKSNYQSDSTNPSTDPDSHNEQNMLHFSNHNHRQNMGINEKLRVATQEYPDINARALHVQNLCVYFGTHNVLNHINFLVERHQIISIVGCNGTGKTILLKAILGNIPGSAGNAGTVISYGVNSTLFRELHNINQINYSSHPISLEEALTVIEIIEIMLRIRGFKKSAALRKAHNLLKTFDLYNCRYHLLKECSIGVQKRLSIALALIGYARLIILDDPFVYLDMISRRKICCIFETQCSHGKSLLYTTSYPIHSNPANRTVIINSPGLYAIGERNELRLNAFALYIEVNCQINRREFYQRSVPMDVNADVDVVEDDAVQKRHMNSLQICSIIEHYFPQSIIKFIGTRSVCFWLSDKTYSISGVLSLLHKNKAIFYSFEISQPSLESVFAGVMEQNKFNAEDVEYYLYTS